MIRHGWQHGPRKDIDAGGENAQARTQTRGAHYPAARSGAEPIPHNNMQPFGGLP